MKEIIDIDKDVLDKLHKDYAGFSETLEGKCLSAVANGTPIFDNTTGVEVEKVAKMKLIIDIDNEAYKGLITEDHIFVKHIFDSVKNGIPLEQISDKVNKLKKISDGNKVYVSINDVFDIIDKYREEQTDAT